MARKSKAAYMISAVAQQYDIHPQTLRLYEREGLLRPSRSDGNTRLYTDTDLERLEYILKLTRDMGVNLAGAGIILNQRERMENMQRSFREFIASWSEQLAERLQALAHTAGEGALVPVARNPNEVVVKAVSKPARGRKSNRI